MCLRHQIKENIFHEQGVGVGSWPIHHPNPCKTYLQGNILFYEIKLYLNSG